MLKRLFLAMIMVIGFGLLPQIAHASEGDAEVYRLYHEGTKDHHYTMDANEYKVLGTRGWTQEGVAWYSADKSVGKPVYRLYYPWTLDHHYTLDENEYRVLGQRGWIQEGVAWYSDPGESVTVYRLYHEGLKDHHYTKDANEYHVLGQRSWKREGVAWYSSTGPVPEGQDSASAAAETSIMGSTRVSADQMAACYRSIVGEGTYPSQYKQSDAPTLSDFCRLVLDEAKAEGVRAEVVFAQAMKETGWLRFGGAVKPEQFNFCGLGAVNSSPGLAASFDSVRMGIRAQVQHLKAYASFEDLVNDCVDPRFSLVKRGSAPRLKDLNGRWAVPGDGYGESIAEIMLRAIKS